MSSVKEREGYRDRLSEGEVVYFVEGEGISGSRNAQPVVKKANVSDITLLGGHSRAYPFVALWPKIDENPGKCGMNVAKSPRELFTEEEVLRAIREHDRSLAASMNSVDALVNDPVANRDLVAVLGASVMWRLAEDEARNPGDPEH